jgi:hypothetical protein
MHKNHQTIMISPDKNVEAVREMLKSRMEVGFKKYGVTTERADIDLLGWLQHAQEEALDLAVYLERIKSELKDVTRLKGNSNDLK